jgi:hypothetical protein
MAVLNSTLYTNVYVNKYLTSAMDRGGRAVPIPFSHTVGADTTSDTVNLCVLPANCEVVGLEFSNDACGGTCTLALGDSGSATRFLPATSVAAAGKNGGMLSAGMLYRPTTDTIVFGTWASTNPTAAAVVKGVFWIIPGA